MASICLKAVVHFVFFSIVLASSAFFTSASGQGGAALLAAGKAKEAVVALREEIYDASASNGQVNAAKQNLCLALKHLRQWEDALDACSHAAKVPNVDLAVLNAHSTACAVTVPADKKVINDCFQSSKLVVNRSNKGADRGQALFIRAALWQSYGELKKAEKLYKQVLKEFPEGNNARRSLGMMYATQGRHTEAEEQLSQFISESPGDHDALMQLGHAVRRQNRVDESIELYKAAERAHPRNCFADSRFYKGMGLEADGRREEALAHYRATLQCDPNHPRALNNLAGEMVRVHKPNESIALYERAVKADPQFFEGVVNLGGAYKTAKRYSEALPLLERAVKMDDREHMAWLNLGMVYKAVGRRSDAIGAVRQALRIENGNRDVYYELARLFNYDNNFDAMLATLKGFVQSKQFPASLLPNADSWVQRNIIRTVAPRFDGLKPLQGKSANGVIVFLCCGDDEEFLELHRSLYLLERFFLATKRYQVVILHEGLDKGEKESLSSVLKTRELQFELVNFKFPAFVDESKVPAKLHRAGHAWSVGYRHMSRFFCKGLFEMEFMEKFDWYWRLDADSMILGSVKYDPFETLASSNKDYGYNLITIEDKEVIPGLWDTVKAWFPNGLPKARSLSSHFAQGQWWDRWR